MSRRPRAARPAKGNPENIAMIENNEQLDQAIAQMGRMQRILDSYRERILPKNPRNFAVFAEGPLDEIRKLQSEIDEYLRRFQPVSAA
jgi:hypothetical protein